MHGAPCPEPLVLPDPEIGTATLRVQRGKIDIGGIHFESSELPIISDWLDRAQRYLWGAPPARDKSLTVQDISILIDLLCRADSADLALDLEPAMFRTEFKLRDLYVAATGHDWTHRDREKGEEG